MEATSTEGPGIVKRPLDLPVQSPENVGMQGSPATPGIQTNEDVNHVDPSDPSTAVKGLGVSDIMSTHGVPPPKEVMSPNQPEHSTEFRAVLGILQGLSTQVEVLTKQNQNYAEQLGDLKEKNQGQ